MIILQTLEILAPDFDMRSESNSVGKYADSISMCEEEVNRV
jgi:hypothetical protein